jgi:hypothetical protein
MLQLVHTLHTISLVHPFPYFMSLACMAIVVCPGWYKLGCLQLAASYSPAPQSAPTRPRCVFRKQSHALLLLLAHLAIVATAEAQNDLLVFTLAVKVT